MHRGSGALIGFPFTGVGWFTLNFTGSSPPGEEERESDADEHGRAGCMICMQGGGQVCNY